MSSAAFVLSVQQHGRTSAVSRIQFPDLPSLADFVSKSPPTTDKVASRGVVGAIYNGNQRLNENILQCTAASLDFDKPLDAEHFNQVTAVLESEGVGFVAHNTWSNHGRFAVIIPFANPTDLAGHAAAVERLRAMLGPYGNFAEESCRPGQLRFVSPNPEYERKVKVFDGDLLTVPSAGAALPSNAVSIAPIPSKPAVADRFALYTEQASPEEKQLFLLALRENIIPAERLDDYMRWFPVVFACFRAWAVNSKDLTEEQKEMWEALDGWSKLHPKWKPDALKQKLTDWLRDRGGNTQPLHIQSVLSHEVGVEPLQLALNKDVTLDLDAKIALSQLLTKMRGGAEVTVIKDEALAEAASKMKAQDEAAAKLRLRGLTFIARAPQVNDRFAKFIDILTALTTQNKAEPWELVEDEWDHFLRPAPMLISLCQIYAMGFAPHVMWRKSAALPPKALNIYMLNIAPPGTGKSVTMDTIHQVLAKTVFKNLSPSYKLHSATGLWINAFERHGPLQLVTSDEAESLIGKQNQKDQHLLALQTSVKQLYDEGKPGRKFRPSAQVQRELREITAPVMSLNLAATPTLLREDIGSAMLNDGFVSRMIVTIDDREQKNQSFDEQVQKHIDLVKTKVNDSLENTIDMTVKFFNDSWRSGAAAHPAGREFFSLMGDEDAEVLANNIVMHFERTDLPIRYVTPPMNDEGLKRFAELATKAKMCWEIPQGMRGTDAEANIESLRVRSETKLCVMSAILTLIVDPAATEINIPIMEWVSDILYTTQYPFYRHLLNASDAISSSALRPRINQDFIAKLRPAIMPGGPLREGAVMARTLRDFSKPWRRLISDLKLPETNDRRRAAEDALRDLEVWFRKKSNNALEFYMTRDLPDGS